MAMLSQVGLKKTFPGVGATRLMMQGSRGFHVGMYSAILLEEKKRKEGIKEVVLT